VIVESNSITFQLREKQYLVNEGLFGEGKDVEAESRGQNRSFLTGPPRCG
jgi:hypothetical protein